MPLTSEQVTVIGDVRQWLWAVDDKIEEYEGLSAERLVFLDQYLLRQPPEKRYPIFWPPEERRRAVSLSPTEHFLLVASRNLMRALDRPHVPREVSEALSEHMRSRLKLLRDVLEHWDEQRDNFGRCRSGKTYVETYPDRTPWGSRWSITEGPRSRWDREPREPEARGGAR